jgi:hypothetical protein
LAWQALLPQALHAAVVVGVAYPLHDAPPELLLLVPPLLLEEELVPPLLLDEVPPLDDDDPALDASDFVALAPSVVPPPSAVDEPEPGFVVGSVCAGGVGSVGSIVVSAPAPVTGSVAPTAHAASAKEPARANAANGATERRPRTNNACCIG